MVGDVFVPGVCLSVCLHSASRSLKFLWLLIGYGHTRYQSFVFVLLAVSDQSFEIWIKRCEEMLGGEYYPVCY